MSDALSFQCPNCGSTVHTDGTQREVKCDYCGSSVAVPKDLINPPATNQSDFSFSGFETSNPEVVKSLETVGKVTAGVTIASLILPIVLTCVILGAVGAILFFVFSSVNQATSSIQAAIPTDFFPTAAPTYTPFPTDTPFPTATPTPLNTPVAYSNVLLKDDFTNSSSGWDKSTSSDYTLEYKNGKYHVLINKQNGGQVVWIGSKYTDMSIEVDVQQTSGPTDGSLGVACRPSDSGGFYAFEFNKDGEYGIYKFTNWSSEPLAEGALDPATLSDTNHIEGVCDGSTLTLLLNGQELLQTQDADYTQGGVGLIVTTGNSGDPGVDVLFSNFLAQGP